jgi:hypothetical protein
VPAALVLVIAGLTQVVFPIAYDGITAQQAGPSLVLVLRNVLLLALLVVVGRDQAPAGGGGGRGPRAGAGARRRAPGGCPRER